MAAQIIIAEYNPEWLRLFDAEKERLVNALSDWPIHVKHIGSTAVAGLAAKPVIDSMIGVDDLSDVNEEFIARLAKLGYSYVPEYESAMPERRYFRKSADNNIRTHQLHVVQKNGDFWVVNIRFPDYLRAHPVIAAEYEALKRKLAQQYTSTVDYARAKSDFVKHVLAAAENENT